MGKDFFNANYFYFFQVTINYLISKMAVLLKFPLIELLES